MATRVLRNPYARAKPAARKPRERRMRLRSSSRCSIRLMPGSSARSERAARARSMGSVSGMEGLGFVRSWAGMAAWARLGREVFGERSCPEFATGRPVDGGRMLSSPEVAMGSGAGAGSGAVVESGVASWADSGRESYVDSCGESPVDRRDIRTRIGAESSEGWSWFAYADSASMAGTAGAAASAAAICFWRSACSEMRSSSSIWVRNSLEARRKSAISLPNWRASTGSFFGPKSSRTRRMRTALSGKLGIESL